MCCSVLSPEIVKASCMTISGERTEQLDIFCRVTGFTSDFLSFIDVELIRFFHGAIQLVTILICVASLGLAPWPSGRDSGLAINRLQAGSNPRLSAVKCNPGQVVMLTHICLCHQAI